MRHASPSPWFIVRRPRSAPAVRLFCFPYAGGAAMVFERWPQDVPDWIEVWAAELPGRSTRMTEPPINDLRTIVDALRPAMEGALDRPLALFGHSMGALIAFELASRFDRRVVYPLKVFVSGAGAPHRHSLPPTHTLSDEEFVSRVRRLSGAPPEVFDSSELVELLMPRWRADFRAAETFACSPCSPLQCPISAFAGSEDSEVSIDAVHAWRDLTVEPFTLRVFSGDHFFIHTAHAEILAAIADELVTATDIWRETAHVRRR